MINYSLVQRIKVYQFAHARNYEVQLHVFITYSDHLGCKSLLRAPSLIMELYTNL